MTTKSQGRINKVNGSNAERYYAKAFRELGFDKCATARYGSRLHDDAKIDLINLPFNIQIKAGKQKNMNPSKVLTEMEESIKEKFPEYAIEHKLPNIMIHKKAPGRGVKATKNDELVIMSFSTFVDIINNTNK